MIRCRVKQGRWKLGGGALLLDESISIPIIDHQSISRRLVYRVVTRFCSLGRRRHPFARTQRLSIRRAPETAGGGGIRGHLERRVGGSGAISRTGPEVFQSCVGPMVARAFAPSSNLWPFNKIMRAFDFSPVRKTAPSVSQSTLETRVNFEICAAYLSFPGIADRRVSAFLLRPPRVQSSRRCPATAIHLNDRETANTAKTNQLRLPPPAHAKSRTDEGNEAPSR